MTKKHSPLLATLIVADQKWLTRIEKRLTLHDLALLTLGSIVAGIVIGSVFVPYARATLIASGIGWITGAGVCAILKRINKWKRK